jgi:hypothetical protein
MFALLLGAAAIYSFLAILGKRSCSSSLHAPSVLIAVVQESRTEQGLESLRDIPCPGK